MLKLLDLEKLMVAIALGSRTGLARPVGAGAASPRSIPPGKQSGLLMHIAVMENVSL
jgi:hypothetical protein